MLTDGPGTDAYAEAYEDLCCSVAALHRTMMSATTPLAIVIAAPTVADVHALDRAIDDAYQQMATAHIRSRFW